MIVSYYVLGISYLMQYSF